MRVTTLISLALLGGSAAALAQVASPPIEEKTGNTSAGNSETPGAAMPNSADGANRSDTPLGNAATDPGKSRR